MRIQHVSLRTLTVSILIVLGSISIFLLFITTLYFRDAALDSQSKSLSRMVGVASQEVVKHVHDRSFILGTTLQSRGEFRAAFEKLKRGEGHAAMREVLNDPFEHGYVNASALDLIKLRVYDLDLKWMAESSLGTEGLAPQLDPVLFGQAARRQGAERLKALGGLWHSSAGSLYSELVPVGGLKIVGYLEVVVNPTFNLASVAAMTRMPLSLYNAEGKMLYQSQDYAARQGKKNLGVEYILPSSSGAPAYRLVSLDDVEQLNADMTRSGAIAALAFVILIGVSVMAALWFFNRFLFHPMRAMQNEMERSAQGDISVTVGGHAVKEFHALAAAFNIMARKVEGSIRELQRLSSVDGLTGINNRRHFDLALQSEWQRAQRSGKELSLILLDIDYFKQYNDSYGHLAGDDCLRMMGALLGGTVQRPGDIVARYGGEEFVILLPDTTAQGALFLAEKIMAELASLNLMHALSPLGGRVTASMGCATCKVAGPCKAEMLVAEADKALYRAKETGRNRIVA